MSERSKQIAEDAAGWMARSRDPRFADWGGLTAWLEADPAHNLAYEAAFDAHDAAGELTAPAPIAVVGSRPRGRWPIRLGVGGSALAAALVGAAYLGLPLQAPATEMLVATKAGETRTVRLRDGTIVQLNGATRLALNSGNGRTARLEAGEAMFQVVHDEARPFTVDVGGQRLVDLGTRFDVVRAGGRTQVAVAEGGVLFDPAGAAVRLGPGRMLRKQDDSSLVTLADVAASDVGTWRQRRLVYRDAAMAEVAGDIARLTGLRLATDPDLAGRPFTGAIRLSHEPPEVMLDRLGKLLDVAVRHRGADWVLASRDRAPR